MVFSVSTATKSLSHGAVGTQLLLWPSTAHTEDEISVFPLMSLPVAAELGFPNPTLERLIFLKLSSVGPCFCLLFVAISQNSLMSSWLSQAGLLIYLLVFPGIRMNPSHVVHIVMAVLLNYLTLQSSSCVISAACVLGKMITWCPTFRLCHSPPLLPFRIFISSLSHSP